MVKEGYKQTEIGVIPEDWDVCCIDFAAKLSSGTTPSRSQEDRYYRNGKYPWVKTTDLNNSRITATEEKVTQEALDETCLQVYPPGTVFIAMYGGFNQIGRTGLLEISAAVNQALIAIQPKASKLNSGYLLATLNYRVEHWKSVASSSRKDPNITSQDVRNFTLPLPDIEEQRAIAATLSDVDALIAALDKLIAKKRHLKTATMQQLLTGKKRLPGFGGDWSKKQIGTEIDLLTGFPFPSEQYFDSGIKLLRGSNIKRGVTDWSDDLVQYWPEVTSDISQYVLNEGDIVVAMDGSLVGRSFARLSKDDLPALLLQRVARIRSDKIDMGYLKEWICSKFFTEHCDAVKTVTAIPHISPGDIRSFTIQVPPNQEEQRAIATVLSDMDTDIAALETRRAKTQAIKQGMMQQLLTGKVRLV
ncbi:MAG: restriction endonuclease subunit S [Shackletoniella antarctica]|jgi:type I restriction enzyme S subunit|uniref:Restriction endonuclease subunit S n=1 Tax=Shackletoniella antarctica TaxID=268115 RepID=A0A2W4W2A4_9CYAN|nr:MAG: restriction endonuclease subunit S [Shackletoniella antarctica]